jgi:hypothetical protein
MPDKKWLYLPPATSPRDYPESMSQYERESLAAEAKLAEERKSTERLKPDQDRSRRLNSVSATALKAHLSK